MPPKPFYKSFFITLAYFTALHVVGIFIFTSGFFLTRSALEARSECQIPPSLQLKNQGNCWRGPKFSKLVIIIIDALRYDFMLPSGAGVEPWQNQFKIFDEILKNTPENAHLFKFLADPPTTTMQRLKAMTTGGMPTFIDAADNFDPSSTIQEDNWLAQCHKLGFKIVMMGDDTWLQLYPFHFDKTYPYPSLIVKDIDTVDNGVIQHLFPTLKGERGDWDIIIAHFLGVDHVGHTYGPSHPIMATKLTQMDTVIREVIAEIDDSTLLLVLGDHGMTHDGNHGGASVEELTAGLFAYSKARINTRQTLSPYTLDTLEEVFQIDIVPTISLLMGIPIPYGNLGRVIPHFFARASPENILEQSKSEIYDLLSATHVNCWQIHRYLDAYQKKTNQLHHSTILDLNKQFEAANNLFSKVNPESTTHSMKFVYDAYVAYHTHVLSTCQELWTNFNTDYMLMGCSVFVTSIVCIGIYMIGEHVKSCGIPLFVLIIGGSCRVFLEGDLSFQVLFGSAILSILFYTYHALPSLEADTLIGVILVILRTTSFFSNSYIEAEKPLLAFFLTTLSFFFLFRAGQRQNQTEIMNSVWLLVVVRLSLVATGGNHETYSILSPGTLGIEFCIPLSALFYFGMVFHQQSRRLHLKTLGLNLIHGFIPLSALFGVIHLFRPEHPILVFLGTFLQVTVIPVMFYMHMVVTHFTRPFYWSQFTLLCFSKLCLFVYLISTRFELSGTILSIDYFSWGLRVGLPWAIYIGGVVGLASALYWHSPPLWILIHVYPALCLLLGQHSLFTFFLMFSFTYLMSKFNHQSEPFTSLLFYLLTIQLFFYGTGHAPQFSALHFQSGFIEDPNYIFPSLLIETGTDHYNFYFGTFLMSLNTFSSHIFFYLSFPVIFPTSKRLFPKYFISILLIHTIWCFGIMLFNFISRRHLMVWRVFAPKYIFDVITLLVGDALGIIVWALGCWVSLDRLRESTQKNKQRD